MTTTRDEKLGRALRELDVPDHGPEFEAALVRRLEKPPRRRGWVPALAAALVLLLAAGAALFLPRSSEVASAAELRTAILDAFGSASTISGVFVNREQPSGGENRWRFVVRSPGSFRITGVDQPTDLAYDTRTNVETYSDAGLFVTRVGLAPGPPDSDAAGWVLDRGLGSVVAALARAGSADVKETQYGSRDVWEVRSPTGNPGEERLITVDRETGIPVRSRLFHNGHPGAEWRIEALSVDDGHGQESFTLRPAAGQQRTRYDMGFRRVRLDAMEGRVGYPPLVPGWVPSGFEPAEVAVAESSRPTGDEQHQNPPSRRVVSLRYRRGLDDLVLTTRLVGPDRSSWGDPVIGSSPMARKPEQIKFDEGALRGSRGELVIDPNSVPHVWAIAGPLVVTVAGNLDREELIRIAESLG
jgi:hypothetical protein